MENEPTEAVSTRQRYEDLVHEVTKMRKKYPSACASYLSIYLKANGDKLINAEVIVNDSTRSSYQSKFLDDDTWRKLNLHNKLEPCAYKVEGLQREISNVHEVLAQIKSTRHTNFCR